MQPTATQVDEKPVRKNGVCPCCGTVAPPYKPTTAHFVPPQIDRRGAAEFWVDTFRIPDSENIMRKDGRPIETIVRCKNCGAAFFQDSE